MAKGHIEDGKVTLSWNLPRLLLPKNRVQAAVEHAGGRAADIPRGGTLTSIRSVTRNHELSHHGGRLHARVPQNIVDLLSSVRPRPSMRIRCSRTIRAAGTACG